MILNTEPIKRLTVCCHQRQVQGSGAKGQRDYRHQIFVCWLNNQNVRNQLKLEIKICLVKNGYPPQYSPEVFKKVMEQVENFEENN